MPIEFNLQTSTIKYLPRTKSFATSIFTYVIEEEEKTFSFLFLKNVDRKIYVHFLEKDVYFTQLCRETLKNYG